MSRRALVLGGAGFLGRHVARALADDGVSTTVLDDLSCANADLDARELAHPSIRVIEGSTFERPLVTRLVAECELVVHFASVVGVEETITRTVETVRNIEGTINVVEALTRRHAVVFGSSADVYGVHSRLFDHPMHEDDLQTFERSSVNRWVYPKVKSLEENLIAGSAASSVNARIFNSYGPGMDAASPKRVISQFMERVHLREPLLISGDGNQTRTFTYYEDTVRGIMLALEHAARQSPGRSVAINIGRSGPVTSILELARLILAIALEMGLIERPLPIVTNSRIYSQHFDDSWHRVPDVRRARQLLNFDPRVSLRDGIRQLFDRTRDEIRRDGVEWPLAGVASRR